MEDLKKEYEELNTTIVEMNGEIQRLDEDEKVQRYLKLKEDRDVLLNKQLEIEKRLKLDEYKNCDHVYVVSSIDHDYWEGRTYRRYGCIKCGLDYSILDEESLSSWDKIMYKYIKSVNFSVIGKKTNIVSDLNLAKGIYARIKENYPNIDDETAIKYLEHALNSIRDNEVNEERKIKRAKRLDLNPNFHGWKTSTVVDK